MCKMRVVVRREMLGAREQAWSGHGVHWESD